MKKITPISINFLSELPRINDVRFSADGDRIIWSESIDGESAIFTRGNHGKKHILSENRNARGGVGYGGGELDASVDCVVFPDRSGSLFTNTLNHQIAPRALTPAWGSVAAPAISPDGSWVLYCYTADGIDGIAITRTSGVTWPSQLALGADFYMQPVWHPSGRKVAWAEWNHPDMPWDASVIKLGEVGGIQLHLLMECLVAGGNGQSASQPRFSPDGKWLSYLIRDGDWDNLMLYDLEKRTYKILIKGDRFHLRQPDWVQGMRSYGWSADSSNLYYFRYAHGKTTLWKIALRNGQSEQLLIEPIEWASQLDVSLKGSKLAFLGSAPGMTKHICLYENSTLSYLKTGLVDAARILTVKPLEIPFPTPGGQTGFGFFYPPSTRASKSDPFPPLILHVHGGPTSAHTLAFSNEAAYFTSHGFAYAQVNYRGSSGYGYGYQDALRHQWGVADTEDTIAFTQALIARGLASVDRMALMGSSAGGFTVLNTLIRNPGLFKAGICSYSVSDLLEDARNTHKFERYYHRFLIGDLKKQRERFINRSPINHAGKIKDPVALFHGDEDKVVSLSQTKAIYDQLVENGIPCELKVYAGEGHGFRKIETLEDYYSRIEAFLKKFLLIK